MNRRKHILVTMLLAAIGVAGVCWYWNRAASSGKDFIGSMRILIHTDKEAAEGARNFLAGAKINTSGYDLAHEDEITPDKAKGYKVWRISWRPKPDATSKTDLVVIAYEIGQFVSVVKDGSNQEKEIWGDANGVWK
jgi:hypothetical protein